MQRHSVFLTAIVSMVLGLVIAVVGLRTMVAELDPPAWKVAGQTCP